MFERFAETASPTRPLVIALAACFAPLTVQAQATAPEAPAPAASAASAAATPPVAATPASAPESGKLPPVIVTAERRSENAKDVPMAITTLSGEKLDVLNSSGDDVRMLSGRVPSLNIESSFGRAFPRFYLRGYGNTDFRLNASQPVSLIYDEVVQEAAILKGFPVFDLDQIEVLAGPQGTLFGRNTPAGVVKFDSAKPERRFGGYGSISYGSFNSVNAEGAINFPVSETTAARVSLISQNRDDWVDNTNPSGPTQEFEGYHDNAARAQLLYKPHKDFSALFNLHARDLDGSARLFRANIIKPGSNDLVDGFDEKKVALDGANESKLQTHGASARLSWGLGGMTLHSITGYESLDTYNRGDIDGSAGPYFGPEVPFPSETADGIPKHRQFTQEVRLESSDGAPLGWQGGVYYFDEDYTMESFSYDSLGGGAQNAYSRSQQKNKAYAAFGALKYAVTPELSVRGGLRYTRDEKDFELQAYESSVFGTPATLADLQAAGPVTASLSKSKMSWDLSSTYKLSPELNVYARVANGFRAASVQGAGQFNGQSTAEPETNTSFEAGLKADLFDNRARVNFNVFHYTVKDQQLTAVGGDSNAVRLLNAEKTVGQGFELDLQAYVNENLLVTLGGSYNDTKIKDQSISVGACGSSPTASPHCTVLDPEVSPGLYSIDGNPLPQAPKWTANFTLRYGMPAGDGGEFFVFTDWAYRSKINFFLYESVEFTGKPLTVGGLRVGYNWGNGKYEAALFARNITNQIRVVGGIDFNNLTGFINEPRTFGAQFKATF